MSAAYPLIKEVDAFSACPRREPDFVVAGERVDAAAACARDFAALAAWDYVMFESAPDVWHVWQLERRAAQEADAAQVRKLIESFDDVKELHRLGALPGGRWLYLVETPFKTFPQAVIGVLEADMDTVHLALRASSMRGMDERFEQALRNDGRVTS